MFGTQEGLLYHFQWSKLLGLDMHTQCLAATRVMKVMFYMTVIYMVN